MDFSTKEEIFGAHKKNTILITHTCLNTDRSIDEKMCINDYQIEVLTFCYSEAYGGHFSLRKTADKILQAYFYWPTLFKDCFDF